MCQTQPRSRARAKPVHRHMQARPCAAMEYVAIGFPCPVGPRTRWHDWRQRPSMPVGTGVIHQKWANGSSGDRFGEACLLVSVACMSPALCVKDHRVSRDESASPSIATSRPGPGGRGPVGQLPSECTLPICDLRRPGGRCACAGSRTTCSTAHKIVQAIADIHNFSM